MIVVFFFFLFFFFLILVEKYLVTGDWSQSNTASCNVRKRTFEHSRSQIIIMGAFWIAKNEKFHQADNED